MLVLLLARGRQSPPRRWIVGLLWLPLAYLGILLFRGLPTLSNPMVYPPLGIDIIRAGAPGLLGLATGLMLLAPRELSGLAAYCRVQLALPASLAVACLVACGGVEALLLGAGSGPPLLPGWTAHASVFLSLARRGFDHPGGVLGFRGRPRPLSWSQRIGPSAARRGLIHRKAAMRLLRGFGARSDPSFSGVIG